MGISEKSQKLRGGPGGDRLRGLVDRAQWDALSDDQRYGHFESVCTNADYWAAMVERLCDEISEEDALRILLPGGE
jgi:hypothetical protein